MAARLQELYKKKILPSQKEEFKHDNDFSVGKIQKIVLNAGIGKILQNDPKAIDEIVEDIRKITGQQPVKTRAAKAISSFKIREGQVVGLSVTLRGQRMYHFLDKLINATFPRIRDFRGVSRTGFDKQGNYTFGIKEQGVFAEMAREDLGRSFGLQVTIVTSAKNSDEAYALLKKLGFPFKD